MGSPIGPRVYIYGYFVHGGAFQMIHTIRRNSFAILCVLLLVIGASVLLISVAPINVLKDWHIKTTESNYHPNGVILLESSSIKLRKANGNVRRTIECDQGKDSTVAYNLNLSVAKRPPGISNTTYQLKIPSNVTNLPANCRVVIAVNYKVYLFRHVVENAVTNDFKVSP